MSLVEFNRILYPEPFPGNAFSTSIISSNTMRFAHIINIPKTGNLSHIGFRTGAVTSAATLRVRVETLDSTGTPTGTLIDANATGSQASPATNTNYEVALAGNVAVTKNQRVAVVIDAPSGTVNLQLTRLSAANYAMLAIPYTNFYNDVTWTKQATSPVLALKYDDGTYPYLPSCFPPSSFSAITFNDTTVAFDEAGNKFTLPMECRVVGFWSNLGTTTGLFTNKLYDASDNVIASQADTSAQTLFGGSAVKIERLDTPVILQPDTIYRQTLDSTDNTNKTSRRLNFDSTAISEVMQGGADIQYTQRKGSGAWTDTPAARMFIGLIIDQINNLGSTGKFKIMTAGGLVDIS